MVPCFDPSGMVHAGHQRQSMPQHWLQQKQKLPKVGTTATVPPAQREKEIVKCSVLWFDRGTLDDAGGCSYLHVLNLLSSIVPFGGCLLACMGLRKLVQ